MSGPGDIPAAGDERFEIQRKLGAGGIGAVFQAYDRERGATVALKSLRLLDPSAIYAFKREFRALADLSHPNLAKLYELLCVDGAWYLTMEIVDGVDFRSWVRPRVEGGADIIPLPGTGETAPTVTRLPPADDLDLGRLRTALGQLVRGVRALHSAGKLHRDLKPSNVLVARDGRVVVCDFGLVTTANPRSRDDSVTRGVSGTPGYMSPEQASSRRLSAASDWYAVGVILYEALTGQLPLAGKRPARPRAFDRNLPEDLDQLCVALLDPDPTRRPDGDEILRRLGVVAEAGATTSERDLFVGREHELRVMDEVLERVRGGDATVVRVHGPSGIGKSALVSHFLDRIVDRDDVVVIEGRCYEQESVPYKALDAAIDGLTRHLMHLPDDEVLDIVPRDSMALTKLFPVLRRVEAIALPRIPLTAPPDPQESRRRAFAGLRQLLASLTRNKLVVLALDDLQWGDHDSAVLLSELVRAPAPRMLVLASYRDEGADSSFLRAFHAPSSIDLPLAPLSPAESADFARELLGDDAEVHALAEQSGGNPFLLSLLGYRDRDRRNASLLDIMQRRLRELSAAETDLLRAVSVAGRPIRLAVARRAAGLDQRADAAVVALRAGRLIRTREGDRLEPYHDRFREIVLSELAAVDLTRWHARLAYAFERTDDADLEALAYHLRAAGRGGAAAAYAARAAEQAEAALAFDRAAALYQMALDEGSYEGVERSRLLARLGHALVNAGRGYAGAYRYLEAAAGAVASDALEYRRIAAEYMMRTGHLDEGFEVIRSVLAEMGMTLPTSPRRALFSLLVQRAKIRLRGLGFTERDPSQIAAEQLQRIDVCWSMAAGLGVSDTIRGMDFQARHCLLALRGGDVQRVARAIATEGMYHAAQRGVKNRRRARRLMDLADEIGGEDPRSVPWILGGRALLAYQGGHFADALDYADRSHAIFQDHFTGVEWEVGTVQLIALWALLYMGRTDEALVRHPRLLAEARLRHELLTETNLCVGPPNLVWLVRDEPEAGREVVARMMKQWSHVSVHLQHFWETMALRQIDIYEGAGASAYRKLEQAYKALKKAMLLRIEGVYVEFVDVRARAALMAARGSESERRSLLRSAAADTRRLERSNSTWSRPLAVLHRAAIAAFRDPGEAITRLEAAEAALLASDMSLYALAARWRRGQLLGGDEGGELLRSSQAELAARCVTNPERMVELLAPLPVR